MKLKLTRYLLVFIGFTLLSWPVNAQTPPPISARVDRTTAATGEFVTLTVVVSGASLNPPQPNLPSLTGFDVVGTGSSSQVSIVNGSISAQATYTYRLLPTQTGDLTIGPVSVTINGQTFNTEPITIQVSQGNSPGSASPAPGQSAPAPAPATLSGQDFFIEAEVDRPDPYVGQQVIYTFRFYQALRLMDDPIYNAPTFTGFWNKQQPGQSQYTLEAANRVYRVTELRTLLFPTQAGDIAIEPATLTIPGSPFSREETLRTEATTLTVRAVPPNPPSDFNGAVGQFTLTAGVDAPQTRVNQPVTLLVTLSGTGNIENLPPPAWPDIAGWRAFESKATTNTQLDNGLLTGSRTYERLMVPAASGEFTIPPIAYVFFDPAAGEYRAIATEPIAVTVAPADEEPPVPVVLGNNKETVARLASDIRHIKPVPPLLEPASKPLTARPGYWLAWAIPLALLGGNYLWLRRQSHLAGNVGLARSLQARKKAARRLAQARKQKQDPYRAAGQTLNGYLSDKLNAPVDGMTRPDLETALHSRGLQPALIKRIQTCLAESDIGRFSPAAAKPDHAHRLLHEVAKLIDDLEKAF